jgi:hypothetical protein
VNGKAKDESFLEGREGGRETKMKAFSKQKRP